ncbi:MAG: prepilin-type N-terminal cleavage/methylation domain-containing protein, partial [Deltaproteobacteria bacterium]|nr:prepilin-type N-terminal cleavage/methylation domain-containing protein [Deltaproteobacteria bacterium]
MIATSNDTPGFTLVELLIAMAIAGVVMAGVYSAYSSQQRSYLAQEQVAAVQQNLRVAMYFMEREIRMAGCD